MDVGSALLSGDRSLTPKQRVLLQAVIPEEELAVGFHRCALKSDWPPFHAFCIILQFPLLVPIRPPSIQVTSLARAALSLSWCRDEVAHLHVVVAVSTFLLLYPGAGERAEDDELGGDRSKLAGTDGSGLPSHGSLCHRQRLCVCP